FINQGRLIALDSPARLKATLMAGQVLEIDVDRPEQAMRLLKTAQADPQVGLADVALYGVQIHAVVPDAEAGKAEIRGRLQAGGIQVNHLERIAPTLEDVFISAVGAQRPQWPLGH
ncbi:MAG TPA: hypothetical protein VGA61_15660, partial [Anaerolineae bacterium]